MDAIPIVVGADDRYAIGLGVTLASALPALPKGAGATLVILDGGISPESRHRLERVIERAGRSIELQWHRPDLARFDGAKTAKWGSQANYLRLLIPELFGDEHRCVLYLDSDLLIRGPLEGLLRWFDPASGNPVYAVEDFAFPDLASVFSEEACRSLGIDPNAPYFNSGVLLIDLKAWRAEDVSERALQFARQHGDLMRFSDQDALNAVLQGHWSQLDPRWNLLLGNLDALARRQESDRKRGEWRRQLLREASILHFSGPRKPWTSAYFGPFRRTYHHALAQSGWFEDEHDYKQWINELRRGLPLAGARESWRRAKPVVARTLMRLPGGRGLLRNR